MAKFQATGNYKISVPPQIGSDIHNFLRYDQIAQAGAPQSLLGEAIYGIGSGIAQMFEDEFKPEKKEIKKEENQDGETSDLITDDGTKITTSEIPGGLIAPDAPNTPTVDNPIDEPPKDAPPTIVKDPKPTSNSEPESGNRLKYLSQNVYTDEVYKLPEGYDPGLKQYTFQDIGRGIKSFATDFISGFKGEKSEDQILNDFKQGKFTKDQTRAYNNYRKTGELDTSLLRLADSGPLKRLKDSGADDKTANHILKVLQGFSYPYKNTEYDTPLRRVAHAENSPFLKTDSLKYREMREMTYDPRKRGSIETAFQEAFNVQVDKYNYSQKVKADFEKEVGDEVGSLVVDVDNIDDTWKKSILDTSQRMKSQLYNDYIDYINGDIDKATYESKKLGYQAEINELSNANAKLLEGDKAFFENKHLIDPDASDSNVVDFWNTREKAPENIAIKTAENGVKYYVGKTINGEDFQLPVRQIANGTSGMNLVMKANLAPDITKIVGGMKKIQEQEILKGGYAMANIPADDPRMQGFAKSQLMAVLNDENVLRSAASTYGGLNSDAYATTIQDSDDREALKRDLVDQIYNEVVVPQYVPERKQTIGTTRSGSGSITAAERAKRMLQNQIGSLPAPTEANFNQYQSFIDPKYDFTIKDGNLLIGLKGKKKATIPFNDPYFKSNFSKFAKSPAFVGSQQPADNSDPLGIM